MNDQRQAPVSGTDSTVAAGGGDLNQGAFERIEEIGSGGIGTVYRGRQVRLDREVAIKEIREIFNVFAGIDRSDILERFQSIVETQASLNHPNIIQIIDVNTGIEFPYSVMELAPRGNLRRVIDGEERPDLSVVLQYFLQILHALNTAHEAGVVHGNLKPENVVLDSAGNALVTDFGLSDIIDSQAGSRNQVFVGVGSVAYMSPEQLKDPNLVSARSDMYSLGIMFYEMLTGEVPGRRSPMPSEIFEEIPAVLDDIFDTMSRDDETKRYESVDEIITELYASDEIVEILDEQAAVLFLSDPSGEKRLEPFEPLASVSGGQPVEAPATAPSEPDEQGAQNSVDDGSEVQTEDADQEVSHQPDAAQSAEPSEAASVGGDVQPVSQEQPPEDVQPAADEVDDEENLEAEAVEEPVQSGADAQVEEVEDPFAAGAGEEGDGAQTEDPFANEADASAGGQPDWSEDLVGDDDLDFGELAGDTSAGEVDAVPAGDEATGVDEDTGVDISESTDAEAEDEEDDAEEDEGEGGEVLDKLDEYGEMFE